LEINYNRILSFARFVANNMSGSVTYFGHKSLGFFSVVKPIKRCFKAIKANARMKNVVMQMHGKL
jgi:hypothetical protein